MLARGVRTARTAGFVGVVLLVAAGCGGSQDERSSGNSSASRSAGGTASASPSATASTTASPDRTAVTGTGGRILLVPADAPGRLGRCTPAPRDGVVCADGRRTTYRFQPGALRTLTVRTAAATYQEQAATWVVEVTVDAAGTRALTALTTTAARTRQQLLVLLPGSRRMLSAPQVNDAITGGDLQISGDFDRARAVALVRQITSADG